MVATLCQMMGRENSAMYRTAHEDGARYPSVLDMFGADWSETLLVPPESQTLPRLIYHEL